VRIRDSLFVLESLPEEPSVDPSTNERSDDDDHEAHSPELQDLALQIARNVVVHYVRPAIGGNFNTGVRLTRRRDIEATLC